MPVKLKCLFGRIYHINFQASKLMEHLSYPEYQVTLKSVFFVEIEKHLESVWLCQKLADLCAYCFVVSFTRPAWVAYKN